MASAHPKPSNVQLTPIFTQDLVTPGIFYFANLDTSQPDDINSWWIVLRCPEESLPQPFRDSKEVSSRAFPFFVIGQGRFVWLERDCLYILHSSQKTGYAQTPLYSEFCDFYDLAVGAARPDPLKFFEKDISEATDRFLLNHTRFVNRHSRVQSQTSTHHPTGKSLFYEEADNSDDAGASVVSDGPQRKRHKPSHPPTSTTSSRLPTNPLSNVERPKIQPAQDGARRMAVASPTQRPLTNKKFRQGHIQPTIQPSPRPRNTRLQVYVKTEEEQGQIEYSKMLSPNDRVNVILGKNMPVFTTSRTAIAKSSVLNQMIQHSTRDGYYIMHPDLTAAERGDIIALFDFMQTGTYHPRAQARPDKQPYGPQALENCTSSDAYSAQLVRAGRLYNLAKHLEIEGLVEYLVEKIDTCQYLPYSLKSYMELAVAVFFEPGPQGRQERDMMERWIIKKIAEFFKDIQESDEARVYYWDVLEPTTRRRKLIRDVLANAAENYHAIGGIPIDLTREGG